MNNTTHNRKQKDISLNIVDIGARYGLHNSLIEFINIADIILIDLDKEEAQRLEKKYLNYNNIEVKNIGLGNKDKVKTVNITEHKGLISTCKVDFKFANTFDFMRNEANITKKMSINLTTLDKVTNKTIDFLKIDAEGAELDILKGSKKQLKNNILAIRAEVQFHKVYQDQALFGDIHNFLSKFGFELLNLEYDGKGHSLSKFTMPNKYGYLIGSDAIWVKKIEKIKKNRDKIIKLALFLLTNNATDVAIKLLLDSKKILDIDDSPICTKLIDLTQTLFKDISYLPSINQKELETVFFTIFKKKLKVMHEYYESKM